MAKPISVIIAFCVISLAHQGDAYAADYFRLFCAAQGTTPEILPEQGKDFVRVSRGTKYTYMFVPFRGLDRGFPRGGVTPLTSGFCTWEDRGFRADEQGILLIRQGGRVEHTYEVQSDRQDYPR